MRAITYERTGGPDVLYLHDRPVPEPADGQVRVRVHRAGVNPTDVKSRAGARAGEPVTPEQTPGQDAAGVVDAVGRGVDAALVGRRVWVREAAYRRPHGTAAEYTAVPADHVAVLPEAASFDLGAALGIPFLTAHRCLTVHGEGPARLAPGALAGRTVLVAGGAGAVGNAAIQLARWSGASVIATVSGPHKARLAGAAGAAHVIDYRREDVAARVREISPVGADIIVEVAAAADTDIDVRAVADNGVIAVYGGAPGDVLALPVRAQMSRNARWQFVMVYTVPAAAKAAGMAAVSDAVADGAVRIGEDAGLPLHHYPLDATAAAHAAVEAGAIGKVLIDVADL